MPTTLEKIQNLTQQDSLTNEEIAFILNNTLEVNGRLQNIELFNGWMRRKYDYHSKYHSQVLIEGLDLSNVNLTGLDLRYSKIFNCTFKQCNLSSAQFWDAQIENLHIWGGKVNNAMFRGVKIERSKIEDVKCDIELTFIETKITDSHISFSKSHVNRIDFSNSVISNSIITVPTRETHSESITTINPTGLDNNDPIEEVSFYDFLFKYCVLEKVRLVNLKIRHLFCDFCNFSDCDILNTSVSHTLSMNQSKLFFTRANIEFFKVFYNSVGSWIKNKDTELPDGTFESIIAIKDNFKNTSNSEGKRKYYLLLKNYEMTIAKRSAWKEAGICNKLRNINKYLVAFLFKILTNFGDSPSRVFYWSIGVILFCGLTSYFFNFTTKSSTLLGNLYLSVITFGTVGYGDKYPTHFLGKILFAAEGIAGILLLSVFVVSLTHKWLQD